MAAATSDTPDQTAPLGAVSPEPTAPREDNSVPEPDLDAEPSPPPKRPEPKLCGICGTQPGKYKCPRCALPYCSVACNKQHKENHPPDPPPQTDTPNSNNNSTSKNPPPPPPKDDDEDPYRILLDNRAAFHRLFAKYPSLPAALTRIQETTLPPPESSSSSSSLPSSTPSFPGMSQQQNRRQQNQPWTRESGLRRGAEALRRARVDPGDTGDGVREFCELVRMLLSASKKRKEGGGEGSETEAGVLVGKVREEVVAEEMGVIERLMREEGG